jgi:hypothetical protein
MQNATTAQAQNHAHHWIIDEAVGPMSNGRCRNCGAEREFRNFPEEQPAYEPRYGRRRNTAAA